MELNGTIKNIKEETFEGRVKKIVALSMDKGELAFIEFQRKMAPVANLYKPGDRVCIKVKFNGKTSGLGKDYNNIVAKNISKIN